MDFAKMGRLTAWVSAAISFATCWVWAISHWGLPGLYAGWIPAVIVAPVAGILVSYVWSFIALTVLVGWHVFAFERGGAFGEASA